MNGIVSWLSFASAGIVRARSLVSPRELGGLDEQPELVEERQARVDHRAGRLDARDQVARELASGGNALLSAFSAGIATASVLGSSLIGSTAVATFSRANASAVVLKSVIRLSRSGGLLSSAPLTGRLLSIQFERSWGWVPRKSWLTTDEYSYAGVQYWIEAL